MSPKSALPKEKKMTSVEEEKISEKISETEDPFSHVWTTQEYDEHNKLLIQKFQALMKIHETVHPAMMPRGAVIQVELPEGTLELSKKQWRNMNKEFVKELQALRKVHRRALKKTRKKVSPSSFSGVYTPVVVGPALREFLNETDLGPRNPRLPSEEKLKNSLRYILAGYGLRNSFQLLCYIAIYVHEMQDTKDHNVIHPSAGMQKALGFREALYTVAKEGGEKKKILNPEKKSTFDILTYETTTLFPKEEPFRPEAFKMYYLASILSLNIYDREDLKRHHAEAFAALQTDEVRNRMLQEFEIISSTIQRWREIRSVEEEEPIT